VVLVMTRLYKRINLVKLENAWLVFRLLVGVVLLAMFVYLVLKGEALDSDLVSHLLMLLIGILETGAGALAFRASRREKK